MVEKKDPQVEIPGTRRGLLTKWQSIISLVIFLLVIAAGLVFIRLNQTPVKDQTAGATDPAPMAASPAIGPESAPVTIVEYGDFGCSTCEYWYKLGVQNQLIAKYGNNIRFVWRDFPVITLLSPKAAEAGQCANEQGKFWEFHDAVYENAVKISPTDLQSYATRVGLDMAKFNECVTSRRYQERVNAEQTEGFDHGFTGDPAFLVNGHKLIGPMSLDVFSGVIDPILASQ